MDVIRVLFLAANPTGTTSLNLASELRKITETVRAADFRDRLDLISRWAVRPSDLMQHIYTDKPLIVHFSGHGTKANELVLEDDDGNPKPVSKDALHALFKSLRGKIRVVFLNACFSQLQAEAVCDIIECAIGMNAAVPDKTAIVFAAAFYRAIGFGQSVQAAFDQAKAALLLEGLDDSLPRLVTAKGVDASTVIPIPPKEPTRSDAPLAPMHFAQIEMATDQCLWEEMQRGITLVAPIANPMGQPWSFGGPYKGTPQQRYPVGSHQLISFFWPKDQSEKEIRVADPIVEFTVVNTSYHASVISRIGIRPIAAWTSPKGPPFAGKISSFEYYELPIDRFEIGNDLTLRLPDPIYLEPNASYRFRLRLRDYAAGVQRNESVIQLILIADDQQYNSQDIYLGLHQIAESEKITGT
jgi:hypothetical protein